MASLLLKRLAFVPERSQLVVEHTQRGGNGHVHVEVLVGAQAAAEELISQQRAKEHRRRFLLQQWDLRRTSILHRLQVLRDPRDDGGHQQVIEDVKALEEPYLPRGLFGHS